MSSICSPSLSVQLSVSCRFAHSSIDSFCLQYHTLDGDGNIDEVPVAELDLSVPLHVPGKLHKSWEGKNVTRQNFNFATTLQGRPLAV